MKQDTRPKSQIEKQTAFAKLLLERGDTCDEIMADSAMEGYNRATLRSLKKRMEDRKAATQAKEKTQTATPMPRTATPTGETKGEEKQPKKPNFFNVFHPADLLYYVRFIIAGAGVVGALQVVGYAVAGLLFCVAVLSLHFVKARKGLGRALHLVALAVVEACAFVADYSWVSGQLWANIKGLPLTVWVEKYQNGAGEWVAFYAGPDVEKPHFIALSVAAVMLFAGAYVVGISIQNSITNQKLKQ